MMPSTVAPPARCGWTVWANRWPARCSICRLKTFEARFTVAHEIHAPWGEIIPDVGPMTADGLLAMGDANKWCELVDGVLIKMSPTGYQRGKYGRRLAQALGVFVDQHELGDVVI